MLPDAGTDRPLVLVVEDHAVNQRVVGLMLAKLGFGCEIACDGERAVAMVQTKPYVAILMDCQMPNVDGYEATRQIRTWEKKVGGHRPIVAITVSVVVGERERCLAAGMDEYLAKPVTLERLEMMLQTVGVGVIAGRV